MPFYIKRDIVKKELRRLEGKPRSELDENERSALTNPVTGAAIPAEYAVAALHTSRHHPKNAISTVVWDARDIRRQVADRTFFRKPKADPADPYGDLVFPPTRDMYLFGWEDANTLDNNAFKMLDEERRSVAYYELEEAVKEAYHRPQ